MTRELSQQGARGGRPLGGRTSGEAVSGRSAGSRVLDGPHQKVSWGVEVAGARGWGREGSLRCSRMALAVEDRRTTATTRRGPAQRGRWRRSAPKVRRSSSAQGRGAGAFGVRTEGARGRRRRPIPSANVSPVPNDARSAQRPTEHVLERHIATKHASTRAGEDECTLGSIQRRPEPGNEVGSNGDCVRMAPLGRLSPPAATNENASCSEVHIVPLQSEQLALAHPGVDLSHQWSSSPTVPPPSRGGSGSSSAGPSSAPGRSVRLACPSGPSAPDSLRSLS
jgi:hypothetical protein